MSMPTDLNYSGKEQSKEEQLDFSNSRAAKKAHDQLVAWALQNYQGIRNARTVQERQWYLNLAFFFGKHHVQLLRAGSTSAGSTRLYTPPAPHWRVRPVINRIRGTIRTELAQLTTNKPNAQIIPASAEDRDMYAALAGEQLWSNFYQDKKLKSIIRKTMWWTLICGNGFLKTYWDATAGPVAPVEGPDGKLEAKPEGDVCFRHETPFHVMVPDFREEEIEGQPFLIHAQVKSPEFIKMNFPTALDGSPVDCTSAQAMDILDDSFMNMIGTQNMNRQQSALILEVWIKPGMLPMLPEGAFLTIVGNKIVQGFQGWPFLHGKFPFAKFDHIPAGKFYSTSLVEDLIPLQKEYNRTRGQIVEAKNRMAKPQLVAARGSVDVSKITTEPGQTILYTPGFDAPRPLPLQDIPNYVTQELERIISDWADLAGQHEVTKGQVPPGVTAATAIAYLQERDESKMIPTFDSMEEGIEKTAQMALSLVSQNWTTDRIIKVTGPDGSFDAMAFKGSDLANNLDIRVEGGSSLPQSKAARQAFIMDMMKMGFIDPNKGLEVMEMGGINKIYDQIQVDQRQAQRENMRMSKVTPEDLEKYQQTNDQMLQENPMAFGTVLDQATGQAVPAQPPLLIPVNTWDNHKAHIEAHNNYRKSQSFEMASPETKALFESHVQEHIAALAQEQFTMNPQAMVGLPPEGEGGPGGEEPQQPGPEPMPEMSGE